MSLSHVQRCGEWGDQDTMMALAKHYDLLGVLMLVVKEMFYYYCIHWKSIVSNLLHKSHY